MLEEVFHRCSLQSSLWWPHQWSLPQVSWKQRGRIEKLSGCTQSPAKITKFKRRKRMVRANSNNINILPTNWVPALPDWGPALVLPASPFTPPACTFLTGFLSISHFNFDFLSLFQSSIALHCWQIDVNASSDNPTCLLKAVIGLSPAIRLRWSPWRPSTLLSQYAPLGYLVPLSWPQSYFPVYLALFP